MEEKKLLNEEQIQAIAGAGLSEDPEAMAELKVKQSEATPFYSAAMGGSVAVLENTGKDTRAEILNIHRAIAK